MCEMLPGETMNEIEKLKKEIEALKAMVAMQTATIEVMKNFHEAEKTMLIHAKQFNAIYEEEKNTLREGEYIIDEKVGFARGGYTGNNLEEFDSIYHKIYCTNARTSNVKSLKDFLKDAALKDKDSVMNKAIDMARTYGTAFVMLQMNVNHEIEYKNISLENVILTKTED